MDPSKRCGRTHASVFTDEAPLRTSEGTFPAFRPQNQTLINELVRSTVNLKHGLVLGSYFRQRWGIGVPSASVAIEARPIACSIILSNTATCVAVDGDVAVVLSSSAADPIS